MPANEYTRSLAMNSPGTASSNSASVRQPWSRICSRVMTVAAEGASRLGCTKRDAPLISTSSNCSKDSSARCPAAWAVPPAHSMHRVRASRRGVVSSPGLRAETRMEVRALAGMIVIIGIGRERPEAEF